MLALAEAIWLPSESLKHRLILLLESPNWIERRGVAYIVGRASLDEAELLQLVGKRVLEGDNMHVRIAAIEAISRLSARRPETVAPLLRRASRDREEDVRRSAMAGFADMLTEDQEILITVHLDGLDPAIDPLEVIDSARVRVIARRLDQDENAVRESFEVLVRDYEIPLRLSWLESEANAAPLPA